MKDREDMRRLLREIRGLEGVAPEIMEDALEALDMVNRAEEIRKESAARRHGVDPGGVEDEMIKAIDAAAVRENEEAEIVDDNRYEGDEDSEDGPDTLALALEGSDHKDLRGNGVHAVAERDEAREDEVGGQIPFYHHRPGEDFERDNRTHTEGGGRKSRKSHRPRPERMARLMRKRGDLVATE